MKSKLRGNERRAKEKQGEKFNPGNRIRRGDSEEIKEGKREKYWYTGKRS